MPYLVKPPNGPVRRMELPEIRAALQQCAISRDWLVKDVRQQGFSTVGELVGDDSAEQAAEPAAATCPRCHAPLPVGLNPRGGRVACPNCRTPVVPAAPISSAPPRDPVADASHRRDLELLDALRRRAIFGLVALLAGGTISVASIATMEDSGFVVLWYGPIIFGIATCASTWPQYLNLQRKLSARRGPR